MAYSAPAESKNDGKPPVVWLVVDIDNTLVDFDAEGVKTLAWGHLMHCCHRMVAHAQKHNFQFGLAICTAKAGSDTFLDAVVMQFGCFLKVIDTNAKTIEPMKGIEAQYLTLHGSLIIRVKYNEQSSTAEGYKARDYTIIKHLHPSIQLCQTGTDNPDRRSKGEDIAVLMEEYNAAAAVLLDDNLACEDSIKKHSTNQRPISFLSAQDFVGLARLAASGPVSKAVYQAHLDKIFTDIEKILLSAAVFNGKKPIIYPDEYATATSHIAEADRLYETSEAKAEVDEVTPCA